MDKQQLNNLKRQSTFSKSKDSTSALPQHTKHDIKSSLEQQKQQNKQKFEEPFFIKIGGMEDNMKIVKQKKKHDSDEESKKSTIEEASRKLDKSLNRKSSLTKQTSRQGTVQEATEEEEQSPGTKSSPVKRGAKKHHSNVLSEDDNYEKVSVDTATAVKTLPQLVEVDVNLDTLKNFLEDIQEAINDHAKSIQVMQGDLKRKAYEKTKISEGLHKECGERPHAFRLDHEPNFLQENFQSDDSTQLKRQAERMMDKFEIIGLNIINFQKYKNESNERLDKLEKLIPKCFTIDQFREESQQMEQRILKYTNDQLGTFQENLNGYKKELNEALTNFNKRVNDNQAETLWRIKDCEELLKSRISDKYVNDAIKSLEDKVTKQLGYNEEKGMERLEKSFKELGQRVIQTNQFFQEKHDDLRKIMLSYDSKISNMATLDRIMNIQTGQKDMKYNLERELEMIQEHVKEVKDKISELSKRFSNLEIAAMNDTLGQYQPTGNVGAAAHHHQQQNFHPNNSGVQNAQSANHTSRNQAQFQATSNDKRSQNSLPGRTKSPESSKNLQQQSPVSPIMRKRTRMDQALMQEIEKKMHIYDEQFFNFETKVDSLKKQLDDKVTKDDVRKLTSDKITKEDLDHLIPSEEITQEKMKYLVRDEIETLQNKMIEQLKQFDNKMIRLRAELDVHGLQRQLERKANEDQVRNDFNNHEFKIGTLDRNIVRMASDFETFQLAINKLHAGLVELQDANRDVLLGKRTNNCLSCGKGGDTGAQVMGKDGRMYRGMDQKGATLPDEVNIPASQYMMYEGVSPMTGMQMNQPNISQNHSANDLPHSAQDFYQKMKPSHSFYDNHYDTQNNLPSVHRKKNSYGNNVGLKNIASHAGIAPSTQFNQPLHTSSQAVNNSFSGLGGTTAGKKKLPFGFQVQKEKKDLFKISEKRGKSNYGRERPQSNRVMEETGHPGGNRPESVQNREERKFNFNNTFDVL